MIAIRERAIRVLELCANDHAAGIRTYIADIAPDTSGFYNESVVEQLALRAFDAVSVVTRSPSYVDTYLEAAALLRDGWNPGDEVVTLKGKP